MKRSVFITVCLALVALQPLSAQTDPHFTQNYTYPMYINPAMVGQSDGDYRASAIYRSQWGALGHPYRTTGISADASTTNNLAVGVNLLNQSAGDGGFNYFNAYASIAYTGVKFGKNENHHVIFAMQAGLLNRHVNESKFKWGEQWNPITGYNAANPSLESFNKTSATTLDMGTGALYYDASPDRKYNIFGGISFYHINKPSDPIISAESTDLNTIPMRFTIHGGASINLMEGTSIVPHVLYNQQGNAKEFMLGVYGQKMVNEETTIMAGGYYRFKDAIAPYVGVDYKNFLVGVSYDVNTSKLGATTRNVNAFEISFSYILRKETKGTVDFIHCPRL
ncbi:MAG TPA: PorP/SprF family type IX secretion system membrane protein [Flavisolibacter sp.]|nr:PorP/SprF family type IX secretion system membrane protein [Flavisolibacter sp.]